MEREGRERDTLIVGDIMGLWRNSQESTRMNLTKTPSSVPELIPLETD